ncbi:MAG: hypothetical protein ACI4C3_00340 [Bacteroides sp.]
MKKALIKTNIEAARKIVSLFNTACALVIRQEVDGTVGVCLHRDGIREFVLFL